MIKKVIENLPWFGKVYQERNRYKTPYPPGHFANPYPDLEFIKKNSGKIFNQDIDEFAAIDLNREKQWDLLDKLLPHLESIPQHNHENQNSRYYFDNPMFSFGDGTFLSLMLDYFTPRNIIEVGSGFSSALMLDKNDLRSVDQKMNLMFIEPYPDRLYSLLRDSDKTHCTIIDKKVQEVDTSIYRNLGENDFLFLDTSHIFKTGSDLNFEFFEILPALKKGVIVHIHDIHFPFEYPQKWVDDMRGYNEIYMLRAFLMYNNAFEILLWPNYLIQKNEQLFQGKMPHVFNNSGGSIWLKKRVD